MRFIKILLLIILFVIIVLFFMQNSDVLSQYVHLSLGMPGASAMDPASLHWDFPPLPLYTALLGAFVIGSLVALLSTFMTRIRLGSELRRANRKAKELEQEVNSLRKLPLQKNSQSGNQGGGGQGSTPQPAG